MSYRLIVSVVPRNQGEFITAAARDAGAGGGTIILGRGTASSNILQLLGFGDSAKDVTYNVVPDCKVQEICSAIKKATIGKKEHFGVMFTVDVQSFFKSGCGEGEAVAADFCKDGGNKMADEKSYEMINIIVNKGYADDAMAAARKAGAGGGTIMNARGTARPDDAGFFGIQIVPEKEILMILVEKEKSDAVRKAVQELPCFAEKGCGVVFCFSVDDFTLLGK